MKKRFAGFLAMVMLLPLAACGPENTPKHRNSIGCIQHGCFHNRSVCGNGGTFLGYSHFVRVRKTGR